MPGSDFTPIGLSTCLFLQLFATVVGDTANLMAPPYPHLQLTKACAYGPRRLREVALAGEELRATQRSEPKRDVRQLSVRLTLARESRGDCPALRHRNASHTHLGIPLAFSSKMRMLNLR